MELTEKEDFLAQNNLQQSNGIVLDKECSSTNFNWTIFLLVVSLSAVLCFCGLGRRTLWQDEGETAVLAQRVLAYGFPKALSGYNLVYQGMPQYDVNYRWTYHPWGQFYLTAASFAVLGQTNFAARFPFAVCGVLTVALLYIFVWRHWHNLTLAALSSVLLATSTTFALHCRQCRYHGLSALVCLATVAVFVELMNRPCRLWWIMFGVALAAQFYTDFGILGVILPGLIVSLWPMKARRQEIIATAKSFSLAGLLIVPGLILHWHRLTEGSGGNNEFLVTLLVYIYYFDNRFVPLLFLLPAAGIFLWCLIKSKEQVSRQDRVIITCAFIIGTAIAGMAWTAPHPYIRYLIPLMGLSKLLLAVILIKGYFALRSRGLSLLPAGAILVITVLVLVFTNGVFSPSYHFIDIGKDEEFDSQSKSKPFASIELAGLIYEITHDYICPNRVVMSLINNITEADETIVVDYGELSLMFYRPDLRIYGKATLPNLRTAPDLLIVTPCYNFDKEHLDRAISGYGYEYIKRLIYIPGVKICCKGNMPDAELHYFVTPVEQLPLYLCIRKDHEDRMSRLIQTVEQLETSWQQHR